MTQPLTTEQLDAIRERRAKATPGPWRSSWDDPDFPDDSGEEWLIRSDVPGLPMDGVVVGLMYWDGTRITGREPDASFIAHAPSDIDALLAEVERLRAERDARPDISPELAARYLGNQMCITSYVRGTEMEMQRKLREHARKVRT